MNQNLASRVVNESLRMFAVKMGFSSSTHQLTVPVSFETYDLIRPLHSYSKGHPYSVP